MGAEEHKDVTEGRYELPESQTARDHEQWVVEMGEAWLAFIQQLEGLRAAGVLVEKVVIKNIQDRDDGLFVVVMASTEDGPTVAFHNARGLGSLWRGLVRRMAEDKLKWRADQYG